MPLHPETGSFHGWLVKTGSLGQFSGLGVIQTGEHLLGLRLVSREKCVQKLDKTPSPCQGEWFQKDLTLRLWKNPLLFAGSLSLWYLVRSALSHEHGDKEVTRMGGGHTGTFISRSQSHWGLPEIMRRMSFPRVEKLRFSPIRSHPLLATNENKAIRLCSAP